MWKCELNANEQLSNVEFPSEKKRGENLFNHEIFFLLPSSSLLIFTLIPFSAATEGQLSGKEEKVDVCGVEKSKKEGKISNSSCNSLAQARASFLSRFTPKSEEREIAAAVDELSVFSAGFGFSLYGPSSFVSSMKSRERE